jgi:1-acyl-sn-glycerol-3-phosphate acyltransferase
MGSGFWRQKLNSSAPSEAALATGAQEAHGFAGPMSLRALRRAVTLASIIGFSVLRFWFLRLRGPLTMEERARWLHQTCRGILKGAGIRYGVEGHPPAHGLVVSNHLSYLDILILSAAMPCFFVAKVEIGGWPFFGKAARMGSTIFLDRSSRKSAMSVAEQMSERLKLPIPVLLFPEGTSSDGSHVLSFHSRLIDPATSAGVPITVAAIQYLTDDGMPERELCWYGNASFAPHLAKVLGMAGFSAKVRFGQPHIYTSRRVAADQTHEEITAMRAEMQLP